MIIVEYSPIFGMRIFTGFKMPRHPGRIDQKCKDYKFRQILRRAKSKPKK